MCLSKKSSLVQNRRWIMSILDVWCLSETKTFEQFSDFLAFTLSYKNSHQLGLNQPTDMFDHSAESWEQGEEDRTWAGGLRHWRSKKWQNILLPLSLPTGVSKAAIIVDPVDGFWQVKSHFWVLFQGQSKDEVRQLWLYKSADTKIDFTVSFESVDGFWQFKSHFGVFQYNGEVTVHISWHEKRHLYNFSSNWQILAI